MIFFSEKFIDWVRPNEGVVTEALLCRYVIFPFDIQYGRGKAGDENNAKTNPQAQLGLMR